MRILVTGFSNFGRVKHNPSEQLVNKLADYYSDKISTHIFECKYKKIDEELPVLLEKYKPEVFIMFGLASRSEQIRLEKYARVPDRLKGQNSDIFESTLPLAEIYKNLTSKDFSTKYSESAGNYYCNYLFYRASQLTKRSPGSSCGFIHIPNATLYQKYSGAQLNLMAFGKSLIEMFLQK